MHCIVSSDSIPNADTEEDLKPIFMDSMRIILCPEVTVVDVSHTVTCKACFISPQNVTYKELMCSVLMFAICKIASTEEDLETDGCSLEYWCGCC
jgi:hypothetical protein